MWGVKQRDGSVKMVPMEPFLKELKIKLDSQSSWE